MTRVAEHVIAVPAHELRPTRHLFNRNGPSIAVCGAPLIPLDRFRRYQPGEGEDADCVECLLRLAARIATMAHAGQVDRDGRLHIEHVRRVAMTVSSVDEQAAIVALLHDVVEDTGITCDWLTEEGFPRWVRSAVFLLTRDAPGDHDYVSRITAMDGRVGEIARRVKLADALDNEARCLRAGDEKNRARYEDIGMRIRRAMHERAETVP